MEYEGSICWSLASKASRVIVIGMGEAALPPVVATPGDDDDEEEEERWAEAA